MVVLLNKPFGVLCQFSGGGGKKTLKDFVPIPGIYPAGRLDADSEGLVVLTDEGELQHLVSHPKAKWPKTYWVQVEGIPAPGALEALRKGIELGGFTSLPAGVREIPEPAGLWEREPPIRKRRLIPTCWLEITLREGRNRQVRRMTAAVGLPTLRLIRHAVGKWTTDGLAPGSYRRLDASEVAFDRPRRGL
jgi:23S rRNA pseudouridine2457 synthase